MNARRNNVPVKYVDRQPRYRLSIINDIYDARFSVCIQLIRPSKTFAALIMTQSYSCRRINKKKMIIHVSRPYRKNVVNFEAVN